MQTKHFPTCKQYYTVEGKTGVGNNSCLGGEPSYTAMIVVDL